MLSIEACVPELDRRSKNDDLEVPPGGATGNEGGAIGNNFAPCGITTIVEDAGRESF